MAAILTIFKQYLLPNQIELKLDGWHLSNVEIQNCKICSIQISKMVTMVAILKILKRHLPNHKLDWAETWWEASEQRRDSELLKWFCSNIQDGHHGGHLKNFKPYLLMNTVDWAQTWWEASEQHRNSELLKWLCSNIQDGHLESLQTRSAPEW